MDLDLEVEGLVLRGREFDPVPGRVVVEDGTIAAVEEADVDTSRIVLPAFVNAHTHLGDSIAKEAGGGLSLEELAPPDGLKHRLLRAASTDELVSAMERSLRYMERTGTGACIEFREGGLRGVRAIERACETRALRPVVLGRETVEAMHAADGYGASGAHDGEFNRERIATRDAGKLFGIHAGENGPADINPALDLEPDVLVHMVHPEPLHFERLAQTETPVVVCPRSNLVTGVGTPPIAELAERTTLALGTDDVMLNGPSMFREMEFAAKLSGDAVAAADVLRMATVNGAGIAGLDCGLIEPGRRARLLVLDGSSDNLDGVRDVVRGVVMRAGAEDVLDVVLPGLSTDTDAGTDRG